eukprot:TRINITY_DN29363_c0_g1_i2.p1 TRINITY_DN29363_c0_g1~~TRINITY_DN29363_c0_g1_i2.p1  ORF type:complete len:246 (-),score=37.44 TRINITY_DN29363_c0_g1_i2:51-788(-)
MRCTEQMWIVASKEFAETVVRGEPIADAETSSAVTSSTEIKDEERKEDCHVEAMQELQKQLDLLRAQFEQSVVDTTKSRQVPQVMKSEEHRLVRSRVEIVPSLLNVSDAAEYTTVMLQCIPFELSRDDIDDMLQRRVPNSFDYLYLPFDNQRQQHKGFAFINFNNSAARRRFQRTFNGIAASAFIDTDSRKEFVVVRAQVQGKAENMSFFLRRASSSKSSVRSGWQPIAYTNGVKHIVSQWDSWQ